jgi:predicted DNA-binding transcriptional regulator AlpA
MSTTTVPVAYTVPDIAKLAGISEDTAWKLSKRGAIPGRIVGLGRLVRYAKGPVDRWLTGQVEPVEPQGVVG